MLAQKGLTAVLTNSPATQIKIVALQVNDMFVL